MTVLAVAVAAGLGAVARHLVATAVRRDGAGIVVVNVVGSLLLGLLVGAQLDGRLSTSTLTVLGTGFCGALTTWSAFAHGVAEDLRAGERRVAATRVAVSLALGLGAAALGLALT
ncbi:hypothetical protein HC251_22655 [Iamia sp. SCSIO 61187]|uniref:CrcB family protein n=1 Tax=Iamia sp. SCSIO 61187 TaxID=2722752 RepID=UPI001C62644B|nr:CrcB family protein [Iamia sp. SCSIO 61187]QYG94952.1 hypothetical protein HC251_22655 [Iamia sp. SCSIO 61187]